MNNNFNTHFHYTSFLVCELKKDEKSKSRSVKHPAEINMALCKCLFIEANSANKYFPARNVTHLIGGICLLTRTVGILLLLLIEVS